MATAKQIEANRRNALRSTGPRTEAGKENSRRNALKHGLSSVYLMLPHENPADYTELRASLVDTWRPANPQEMMLVDQIAQSYWRIQRGRRFETAMFNTQIHALKSSNGISTEPRDDDDNAVVVAMADKEFETGYNTLFRYDGRAESAYYRAMDRLRQLQQDRRKLEQKVEKTLAAAHPDTIATPSPEPPAPVAKPAQAERNLASFGRRRNSAKVRENSVPSTSDVHDAFMIFSDERRSITRDLLGQASPTADSSPDEGSIAS